MSETLADNYARGGFGKSLQFGRRPALLVIDFVRAYLVKTSPLYAGVEQARADCEILLRAARAAVRRGARLARAPDLRQHNGRRATSTSL